MKKYIVLLFLAFSCMNALHARKGFDREIKQTLFVPKGTWMGGVSFSYMELTGDDYKFLVLDDMGGEGYTFKVSPYVGYFIKDNIAVGARFNYNRTYADIGNIDIDLGDDLNFNISDYKYLEAGAKGELIAASKEPYRDEYKCIIDYSGNIILGEEHQFKTIYHFNGTYV